jgi:hypothetical protein
MNLFKKQRAAAVLSLAFDGNRLEGVVLRRSNGSLQAQKTFTALLALSPMSADPDLAGREIRNHLEQAGIRERNCVVALPLSAALTTIVEIPDMPEEDVASFLAIEAERSFPYGQDALLTGTSRFRSPAGKQYATLVAYPRNDVVALENALRAAQLKPLSFSIGINALQNPSHTSSNGVLALVIGDNTVDLQITWGGGIVALRSLNGAFDMEGVQKHLSAEFLLREIRITLGQLPAEFREAVRLARVFGRGDMVRRFINEFTPRARSLGLVVEQVERYAPDEFPKKLVSNGDVSPALSVAARYLIGAHPPFEFLPPRTSPWQQFSARFSSRKLAWAGATAGAAALLVVGAFAAQQWQLSKLSSEWAKLEPRVKELDDMQQQIRKYRSWFDESFGSLAILRKVTEAFPTEGVVTAKTLEIRNQSSVTCSGTATDNQAFLKVLDQLRAAKEISNLKVDQVRGKTPLQFTFNFQWGEGGGQ